MGLSHRMPCSASDLAWHSLWSAVTEAACCCCFANSLVWLEYALGSRCNNMPLLSYGSDNKQQVQLH